MCIIFRIGDIGIIRIERGVGGLFMLEFWGLNIGYKVGINNFLGFV